MTFDQLINNPELKHNHCELEFPQSWCQGRTAFGGLSAALMLQNMKYQLKDTRRLLSMSVNFIGPLFSQAPFSIDTQILRQGKNATQMTSTITQNEQVCLVSQACFGQPRPSKVVVPSHHTFSLAPANPLQVIPHHENITPAFFQHIDLNLQNGDMPFTHSKNSTLGGWMKFKEQPTSSITDVHLLALADAWPPTLLQMASSPSPASSMSWYIEFLKDVHLDSKDWLGFEAKTHHSSCGYGMEDANIYSPDGNLLAMSRQTVAIFDM